MTSPDPGLQPERTLLAWRRTALGLVVNGLLLTASGRGTSDVRSWLGVAVVVLALCCWAAVSAIYRRSGPSPAVLGTRVISWSTGALVLGVGVFDLYAVLTV
jgi:uncharacterized membrane protein YidH (DUF202 family)